MHTNVTSLKLVVTGPFAAGKTALISAVSEIPVVTTETGATEGGDVKSHTTVTLDFGKISVGDADQLIELYLFGTPGQSRFDFMWEILSRGMIGYVLVVDASRPQTWREAKDIKDYFNSIGDLPWIVAANRCDSQELSDRLRYSISVPPEVPIVPCQAIERASVKNVLVMLLTEILDRVEAIEAAEVRRSRFPEPIARKAE